MLLFVLLFKRGSVLPMKRGPVLTIKHGPNLEIKRGSIMATMRGPVLSFQILTMAGPSLVYKIGPKFCKVGPSLGLFWPRHTILHGVLLEKTVGVHVNKSRNCYRPLSLLCRPRHCEENFVKWASLVGDQ